MDYGVLLSNYERTAMHREGVARASQQHRLYACLRAAILSGQIEEGTRLAPHGCGLCPPDETRLYLRHTHSKMELRPLY